MARYRFVGGPQDGEQGDELPEGYVALGTGTITDGDPNGEATETAEYEG
jgi:hypothetical protein